MNENKNKNDSPLSLLDGINYKDHLDFISILIYGFIFLFFKSNSCNKIEICNIHHIYLIIIAIFLLILLIYHTNVSYIIILFAAPLAFANRIIQIFHKLKIDIGNLIQIIWGLLILFFTEKSIIDSHITDSWFKIVIVLLLLITCVKLILIDSYSIILKTILILIFLFYPIIFLVIAFKKNIKYFLPKIIIRKMLTLITLIIDIREIYLFMKRNRKKIIKHLITISLLFIYYLLFYENKYVLIIMFIYFMFFSLKWFKMLIFYTLNGNSFTRIKDLIDKNNNKEESNLLKYFSCKKESNENKISFTYKNNKEIYISKSKLNWIVFIHKILLYLHKCLYSNRLFIYNDLLKYLFFIFCFYIFIHSAFLFFNLQLYCLDKNNYLCLRFHNRLLNFIYYSISNDDSNIKPNSFYSYIIIYVMHIFDYIIITIGISYYFFNFMNSKLINNKIIKDYIDYEFGYFNSIVDNNTDEFKKIVKDSHFLKWFFKIMNYV